MMGALDRVGADTDRQRLVIGTAALTRFAAGILMGTGFAVLVERVGGSPFAVSLVLTAYFAGMMLFAPVWGAIADVTGRRRLLLLATGGLATLATLPALAVEGVWGLIGVRAAYAVFAVGFTPVMLTVVSARGGETGRGRAMGFFNSARAVGFAGGQLAVGALLGVLAPAELHLVIAGVSLVSTAAVAFLVDPTPTHASVSRTELRREVRRRLLPAPEDRAHLRRRGLRWLYVALALRNMTVLGTMSLMPVYLTAELGVSTFVMGALLAINPVGQAVFMLAFGRVADAVGRKPLITLGIAGSGAFAVLVAGADVLAAPALRIAVTAFAFVVIAAAFSAMTTGALAFIGDVAPRDRESELMGLRSTAKGLGGLVGPPLIGGLATVTSYSAAFLAGSALAFGAAGLIAAVVAESHPEKVQTVAPGDD